MAFDFRQKLVDDNGEIDEEVANGYVEELARLFAESPEGVALHQRGLEPGSYLGMFLDYELRYVGTHPAEMDASDVREALDVFARKVTGRPEELDQLIPELEAFCQFAQRAFGLDLAVTWKREIQRQVSSFRHAIRDPKHWGMAKAMMMEGMARGYDFKTENALNDWMLTYQAEQLARLEAGKPVDGGPRSIAERIRQVLGRPDSGAGPTGGASAKVPVTWEVGGKHPSLPSQFELASGSERDKSKERARKKQARASRRRNRR